MPAIPNCVKQPSSGIPASESGTAIDTTIGKHGAPMPLTATGRNKRLTISENEAKPNLSLSEPSLKRQKIDNGPDSDKSIKQHQQKPKMNKKALFTAFFKQAPTSKAKVTTPKPQEKRDSNSVIDLTTKIAVSTTPTATIGKDSKMACIGEEGVNSTADQKHSSEPAVVENNVKTNVNMKTSTKSDSNQSSPFMKKKTVQQNIEDTTSDEKQSSAKAVQLENNKDEEFLADVAGCIVTAFTKTSEWIRLKVMENKKYESISKNKLTSAIKRLGEKIKKEDDPKKIWYLKPEYQHYLNETQRTKFEQERQRLISIVIKTPGKNKIDVKSDDKGLDNSKQEQKQVSKEPEDPKYIKYKERLRNLLKHEIEVAKTQKFTNVNVEALILKWKESQQSESEPRSKFETPDEVCIIARLVQGSSYPLSKLVRTIVDALGGDEMVAPTAIEERVLLTAQRKSYGVKDTKTKWEDSSEDALWTWEVDNLDLLTSEHSKTVVKQRKRRKTLLIHINSINRMLGFMRKMVEAGDKKTFEMKISTEEEKVLKFIREEETKKQKAEAKKRKEEEKDAEKKRKAEVRKRKEQEKDAEKKRKEQEKDAEKKRKEQEAEEKRLKAQPKVTLNNFFKKTSKCKTPEQKQQNTCQNSNVELEKEMDRSFFQGVSAHQDLRAEVIFYMKTKKKEYLRKIKNKNIRKSEVANSDCDFVQILDPSSQVQNLKLNFGEKLVDSVDVARCMKSRKKLLQFFEDARPPYFGTYRKYNPILKSGRKPFAKQENIDYSHDSADEWEEVEDGESLASDEAHSEDEMEEGDDGENDWLADENDLLAKVGAKRQIIGVTYNCQELQHYRVEGLPQLPLKTQNLIV